MIEDDSGLPLSQAQVKLPRKSKWAHIPRKERLAASQRAFRERNPDYHKKWKAGEFVLRGKPKKTADMAAYQRQYSADHYIAAEQSPCPKCGSDKTRVPSGQWSCFSCRNARLQKKADWLAKQTTAKDQKAEKAAARIQRDALAVQIRARRNEQARLREENRRLIAARPKGLVSGMWFTEREISRFWSFVKKTDECWNWTGPLDGKTPRFSWSDIDAPSHRVAFFFLHGPPSDKRMERSCQNSKCVNPEHLVDQDIEAIKADAAAFRARYRSKPGYPKPMLEMTPELIARFWSKVDKSGDCWRWTSETDDDGYGRFIVRSVIFPAHRVSFFLHYGQINNSLQTHHSCDSPFCVRPGHLSQGDNTKNYLDSVSRRRITSPDFIARKLIPTTEQVAEIHRLLSAKVKPIVISRKFGASLDVIQTINDRGLCR